MLILASNSPRRRELLAQVEQNFTVIPSFFREEGEELSARDTVLAFAAGKAREVFSRYPAAYVLGADTVVSLDGEIFGKPASAEHAAAMLRALSGRTHEVYTGVCLVGRGFERLTAVCTRVEFYPLDEELIARYVQSGLPFGKAGAYGIQDGYPLVKQYEGSYTNVVGLPVEEVRAMWKACGGSKC